MTSTVGTGDRDVRDYRDQSPPAPTPSRHSYGRHSRRDRTVAIGSDSRSHFPTPENLWVQKTRGAAGGGGGGPARQSDVACRSKLGTGRGLHVTALGGGHPDHLVCLGKPGASYWMFPCVPALHRWSLPAHHRPPHPVRRGKVSRVSGTPVSG